MITHLIQAWLGRPSICQGGLHGVVRLHRGEACSLRLHAGQRVRVSSGTLWLTQCGEAQDHVLGAGASWPAGSPLDRAVTVVVGAVGLIDCAILVEPVRR